MKTVKSLAILLAALLLSLSCIPAAAGEAAPSRNPSDGMYWPEERIFPAFSEPEGPLTAFPTDLFDGPELTALACLQGFANAKSTQVAILDGDVEAWLAEYGYTYDTATAENAYEKIRELCADAVLGAVLYSEGLSGEYRNLANSVGSVLKAVPLTRELYEKWSEKGIELPVLADLTGLTYRTPAEIYGYFYENYWPQCSRRILTVQRTDLPFQMRDLAAATGGAVVYLSCGGGEETELFKKFLRDMTPGASIVTGWYAGQERELMSAAGECGLSCVPSDFFSNATVFAKDRRISAPAVPDMPKLENKIYIAYFLSDGDNIQYDMHAMRAYWDGSAADRGQVAVNWTISPALADIAPEMMNYYYAGATDSECFVCGPSGMGYVMPLNTFGDVGNHFPSDESFRAYVELTDRYLRRSGLRAVTVWDNLSKSQRDIYSRYGNYLYGVTVQNFTDASLRRRYTGRVNDMLFIQQTPAYFAKNAEGTTPLTQIENDIKDAVKYLRYNGGAPVFVAAQASVWAFHDIGEVAALKEDLCSYYAEAYGADAVEFVRADHFFNLYYEAYGLPVDITLRPENSADAGRGAGTADSTTDGSCATLWTAEEPGEKSVVYSLGAKYTLNRVSLYHAEAAGLDPSLNTADFTVSVSTDGETWTEKAHVTGNRGACSDVRFDAVDASYVKITLNDPGADGVARIADIGIYGRCEGYKDHCPRCGKVHKGFFDSILGLIHRVIFFFAELFGKY